MQYIEKDAALARRFQPIMVTEPSVEDAISILRGRMSGWWVVVGGGGGVCVWGGGVRRSSSRAPR